MECNQEKIKKIGSDIADVLEKNDAYNENGLAALILSSFSFLERATEVDKNGKKKERMQMVINEMFDAFAKQVGLE